MVSFATAGTVTFSPKVASDCGNKNVDIYGTDGSLKTTISTVQV